MRRRAFIGAGLGILVAAYRLSARAQPAATKTVGVLSSGSPESFAPFLAAFVRGLAAEGYVEHRNIAIEYRWARGQYDRLPTLAAELASRKVDVILASGGTPSAVAAKGATSTIPIVFPAVSDPEAKGLVASLARPGGNVTGFSIMGSELMPKRLELLFELLPRAQAVALLWNPKGENTDEALRRIASAARARSVRLDEYKATTLSEIEAAFAGLAGKRPDGLIVADDAFFTAQREHIVALASRYAVPAIYQWRDFVIAGGLISYGVSLTRAYQLAGDRVGKILKGAKPSDLPVEQPPVLELVVNLRAAKAFGLTIPASILARADEVIE
jgi:putative ABC transport system substrate-binding protein